MRIPGDHTAIFDETTTGVTRRALLMGSAGLAAVTLAGCGGDSAPPVAVAPPVAAPPAPPPVVTPPAPPTTASRLQAALATGRVRPVPTAETATVTLSSTATVTEQLIAKDDARLRQLGGRWAVGSGSLDARYI